ncbi:MAG: hypothetical protein RJB66_1575 [Pseudomonadota bacterium]|jgi:hypothetical protein
MITLKGKMLLAISTMIVGQTGFAKGEWDNFREATPEALFGNQTQESIQNSNYTVRSGKMNSQMKEVVYRCQGVNTSIEMAQFQGMVLTDGITISALYSKSSGKLVSILARGKIKSQGITKNMLMALDAKDCSVDSYEKDYFGYRPTKNQSPSTPRSSAPMDPAMPQSAPQPQACDIAVRLNESNSDRGHVAISCRYQTKARIFVKEGSTILCDEKTYVGPATTKQCDFERDTTRPSKVQVEVTTETRSFKTSQKFSKAPSFLHPVQASYQMTSNYSQASASAENFPFRGTSFKSEIKVQVEDQDILTIDPENEIRVDLVNLKTGKIVGQRYLSTGATTTFYLTGFFEVPRLFGKPHWSNSRILQPGINEFAVVVHDAYQEEPANALKLETIRIEVPEMDSQK